MMAGLFPLDLTHLICKTDNPLILIDNPRVLGLTTNVLRDLALGLTCDLTLLCSRFR